MNKRITKTLLFTGIFVIVICSSGILECILGNALLCQKTVENRLEQIMGAISSFAIPRTQNNAGDTAIPVFFLGMVLLLLKGGSSSRARQNRTIKEKYGTFRAFVYYIFLLRTGVMHPKIY